MRSRGLLGPGMQQQQQATRGPSSLWQLRQGRTAREARNCSVPTPTRPAPTRHTATAMASKAPPATMLPRTSRCPAPEQPGASLPVRRPRRRWRRRTNRRRRRRGQHRRAWREPRGAGGRPYRPSPRRPLGALLVVASVGRSRRLLVAAGPAVHPWPTSSSSRWTVRSDTGQFSLSRGRNMRRSLRSSLRSSSSSLGMARAISRQAFGTSTCCLRGAPRQTGGASAVPAEPGGKTHRTARVHLSAFHPARRRPGEVA
mmetsp:Transcript_81575/g.251800  ORF Transcript_81575/g.251800 Transcript_81575/m.251800 type:complete len:257 (+) Transcript_81575:491-1261(+)